MIMGLLAVTAPAFATITNPVTEAAVNNATTDKAKAEVLEYRLKEIKDMDKSDMSRAEKKELRKEVKEIKTTMKALSGECISFNRSYTSYYTIDFNFIGKNIFYPLFLCLIPKF